MNTSQENSIQAAIYDLEKLYWLDGLVAELSLHHRNTNFPEPPDTSIGRAPCVLPFLKPNKVCGLHGYETLAIEAYNKGVVAAYRCIAYEYSGLFTAVANEARGTEEWQLYLSEAKSSLIKYFEQGVAWEEFEGYMLEPAQEWLESEEA